MVWIMVITATLAGNVVSFDYNDSFRTKDACNNAVPHVAIHLKPQTNGMISFKCVEQERKS